MKPQLPSLPKDTFVAKGGHDPLLHNTHDLFWFHIEPFFKPINEHDVSQLEAVHVDTKPMPALNTANVKEESLSPEDAVLARMQNYPLARRLMAAMIDEGKGRHANATKPGRSGLAEEDTWIGGSTPQMVHEFDQVLEERVKIELQQRELIDPEATGEVVTSFRLGHWHLRNLAAENNNAKREIMKKILPELSNQAARRTKKMSEDHVEIKYLESMMEKGGKRGKGRFQKLLNQMHPNRNLHLGDPVQGPSKPGVTNFGEKSISKKRKKKHSSNDRSALKNAEHRGANGSDGGEKLAQQIANIIWKHNNQAPFDDIVKEYIEGNPQHAGDVKEARQKIHNCITCSRKPFRFRKLSDGTTYSVTRVGT